jgi:hypothetical protein
MNVNLLAAIEDQLATWHHAKLREIANRRRVENRGPIKPRCPLCRLKIRRPGHNDGDAHQRRLACGRCGDGE